VQGSSLGFPKQSDGTFQVEGVPQRDGGDHQVKTSLEAQVQTGSRSFHQTLGERIAPDDLFRNCVLKTLL
jgi:hypothetical protein